MFDPFDAVRDVIENAKLDAYLGLMQARPDILDGFRVLLQNGCPPRAINAFIEYFLNKGQQGQNET